MGRDRMAQEAGRASAVGQGGTDPTDPRQDLVVDGFPVSAPGVAPGAEPSPPPAEGNGVARPTFAEVYDGHFKAVWLALRRFGVWERDLDDAAHDVFLVVHRRLPDYDPARPLRPWLLGIAARVASEFRRRAHHRREVVSEDVDAEASRLPVHTPPHGVRADRAFDDKERRALLQRALDALEHDRRVVVVLHDIEGHPIPDIAAALDVNVNTLYARLRQGRIELKAAVAALTGGGT